MNDDREPENTPNPWLKSLMVWGGIFLALLVVVSMFGGTATEPATQIKYSDFREKVIEGSVREVQIAPDRITGTLKNDETFSTIPVGTDTSLPALLEENEVSFSGVEAEQMNILWVILIQSLPFLLILGVAFFALRQVQKGGGAGGAMGFGKSKAKLLTERSGRVTFDDVAGIDEAREELQEIVEFLRDPQRFSKLGGQIPKGALLVGSPGTGKTLLARAVASEADARFFHIAGPEIMGRYYGESEQRLREVFEKAQQQSPSIIFIDEIDSIAPKREEVTGEVERRVVAQLLTLLDGLEPRQNVVVIGATNRVDAIDEALRRPGRFDREIVIGVPDVQGRREILSIHTRGMPLEEDVALDELARVTYGFVGADMSALAREAAMETLRRSVSGVDLDSGEIPREVIENLRVTREDFMRALKRVQPSALREIMIEAPNVSWDDVGGLDDAKRELRDGVELPLRHPQSFERLGIRPAKGFLLFGPPGTGKTMLAKAVAREAEANFIATKSSDLLSKWYGESERQVSRLFQRARQVAPTVIFIDEIDAMAPTRGGGIGEPAVTERVVNTLLAEMDGLEELRGVVVIAASNRPALLDPALLRPGRFDDLIYVPVPEPDGRLHILKIHTRNMPLGDDVDLESVASRTDGYTGADLEDVVRRAGLQALRDDLNVELVTMNYFEDALKETRASVTPEMDREYRDLVRTLKQESPRGGRIGFAIEPEQQQATVVGAAARMD